MLPKTIVLETERLLLQELTTDMYDLIMSTYDDVEINKVFGHVSDSDLINEKTRYQKGMTCYYHTFKRFTMVEKDNNTAIGQCGYHKWHEAHKRAEIVYAMSNPTMMNKGYMSEALPAIIEYGFNHMHLNRIEAFINPHNAPAIKLVTSLGFSSEGVLRDHFIKDGITEDSACYALLRKEFNLINRTPQNS